MNAILAQSKMEIRLTLRRMEAVLITLIVPILLLVFFASIGFTPDGFERPIDFLLPGMLALAVMSTGLVGLAIRTAYERNYGVLKRLGTTPLTRAQLLISKVISVVVVILFEIVILIGIAALFYDWQPTGALPGAVLAVILGTITFSALGLLLAGAFRAETTLAAANTLYILFLMLGGVIWPIERLPDFLSIPARLLPSNAFAESLRMTLTAGGSFPIFELVVLAIWGVLGIVVASRTFRWD